MFENYFKPTSKSVLKVSLALKGFIGSISAAAFFNDNKNAAFYFLVAGAFIDFIIQCLDSANIEKVKDNAGKITMLVAILSLSFFSCKTIQSTQKSERTDSTWTDYKPVEVDVKGASVTASLNTDSVISVLKRMLSEATAARATPAQIDSILTNALKGFQGQFKGQPTIVTDPESKVQLKYWVDQFGKLNMECSSKDQTIQMLVAEINKLSKEKHTETVIKEVPTWYTWVLCGYGFATTMLLVFIIFFKK